MEEIIASLKDFFNSMDVNKDGRLNREELSALLKQSGFSLSDEAVENFFTDLDVDKSGDICFLEFSSLLLEHHWTPREITVMKLRRKFRDYGGGSEYITPEVLRTTAKDDFTDAEIDSLMTILDTNKDGKISFEEFLNGLQTSTST